MMTRDEIIKLAREADAAHDDVQVTPFLERFAALVAAAPELLEALKDYDDAFTGFDPSSKESRHRMRQAVIKARSAIAKATT